MLWECVSGWGGLSLLRQPGVSPVWAAIAYRGLGQDSRPLGHPHSCLSHKGSDSSRAGPMSCLHLWPRRHHTPFWTHKCLFLVVTTCLEMSRTGEGKIQMGWSTSDEGVMSGQQLRTHTERLFSNACSVGTCPPSTGEPSESVVPTAPGRQGLAVHPNAWRRLTAPENIWP